jgi:hypothetical protein
MKMPAAAKNIIMNAVDSGTAADSDSTEGGTEPHGRHVSVPRQRRGDLMQRGFAAASSFWLAYDDGQLHRQVSNRDTLMSKRDAAQ